MTHIKFVIILAILTIAVPHQVYTAKILALFSFPITGQYVLLASLLNGLSERGHEIVAVSSSKEDLKLFKNVQLIKIEENYNLFEDIFQYSTDATSSTFYDDVQRVVRRGPTMCSNILHHPQVQHLMKTATFNLIIVETFMAESLFGLAEFFGAPLIGFASLGPELAIARFANNIWSSAVVPNFMLQATFDMSFTQRLLNVALNLIDVVTYDILYLPQQRRVFNEIFTNSSLTFDNALTNFSLVLLNQHFSLSYVRPYIPQLVDVAGLHIKSIPDRVSLSIQKFLDDSSEDVVYINLDNSFAPYTISMDHVKTFVETFAELNYKAIWQTAKSTLKVQSNSILFIGNSSQSSILAHPHVKLFITRGDLVSISEAIYYAKPVLGIPMFDDHYVNVNMAVAAGYALQMKVNNLNAATLRNYILELLHNPRYLVAAQEISEQFRDQPMKPLERAIYWVEYIVRHRGASHLALKGRPLKSWQYHNVDIFVTFLVGFAIIVLMLRSLMLCVYSILCKLVMKLKRPFVMEIKEKIN